MNPCFNPRPPITAGESLAGYGANSRTWGFQSAPANYGGRILAVNTSNGYSPAGFNPRPPITAGESDATATSPDVLSEFQSAPANYGGRIPVIRIAGATPSALFQSAPANYGGRIRETS